MQTMTFLWNQLHREDDVRVKENCVYLWPSWILQNIKQFCGCDCYCSKHCSTIFIVFFVWVNRSNLRIHLQFIAVLTLCSYYKIFRTFTSTLMTLHIPFLNKASNIFIIINKKIPTRIIDLSLFFLGWFTFTYTFIPEFER